MKAEMVSMSGSDSTILAHYQSRVSDGAWHHLQLSVVGNRATPEDPASLVDNKLAGQGLSPANATARPQPSATISSMH